MKTLNDLGLPKDILKKKKFRLYKAYVLKDGDEMDVSVDFDVYGLSHISAAKHLLSNMDNNDLMEFINKTPPINTINPQLISFLVMTFDTEDILHTPLLSSEGDVYYKDDVLSYTLRDKQYKISVEDRLVRDIEIDINPANEIKTITNIILE